MICKYITFNTLYLKKIIIYLVFENVIHSPIFNWKACKNSDCNQMNQWLRSTNSPLITEKLYVGIFIHFYYKTVQIKERQ